MFAPANTAHFTLLIPSVRNDFKVLCSGLMKPDTHLGENARQIEVSDDQTTPCAFL